MRKKNINITTIEELMADIEGKLLVDAPLYFLYHEKIEGELINGEWVTEKRVIMPCTNGNLTWLVENIELITEHLVRVIQELGDVYYFVEIYRISPFCSLRHSIYTQYLDRVFRLVDDRTNMLKITYKEAIVKFKLKAFLE